MTPSVRMRTRLSRAEEREPARVKCASIGAAGTLYRPRLIAREGLPRLAPRPVLARAQTCAVPLRSTARDRSRGDGEIHGLVACAGVRAATHGAIAPDAEPCRS